MINGVTSAWNNQPTSHTEQRRVNLPSSILSKSEPKMSDEEFEQKIIEMAKRDFAAGRSGSNDINSEFHALRFSFISVVSPDREGMINNALPTILNKIREYAKKEYKSYDEMIMDLLFGIEPPRSSDSNMGQKITLFELKDENGNLLARLSTGGWEMFGTPAENARDREFITIYNKAWDTAKHESINGSPDTRRPDGWAMPNVVTDGIKTVDASEVQAKQGQAAQTAAKYEANLHEGK